MTVLKSLIVFLGTAAVLAPRTASAETPGRHPLYLHARSDLRAGQWLLRVKEEPNVTRNLRAADREVEAAIKNIDHAAVLDRKDIDDHPPVDTNLDRPGRFNKIVALLRSARRDLERDEDNLSAVGWRDSAIRRVNAALEYVRRAAVDLEIDRSLGF